MRILWKLSRRIRTIFCTTHGKLPGKCREDCQCQGTVQKDRGDKLGFCRAGRPVLGPYHRVEPADVEDFAYAGVNPCAEEPLPAGGSCLLGSVNLAEFVQNAFTDTAFFDFDSFKKCVQASVNALNEVLEEGLPLHPLDESRGRAWKNGARSVLASWGLQMP